MTSFGFIGTGNMGGALARAACRTLPPKNIFLSNRSPEKARTLAQELGCTVLDNQETALQADFLFLGVKPQMMEDVLRDLAPTLALRRSRFVLVTMAAGLTMKEIQRMSGNSYPVIRIMPNTPCAVGAGMILYTLGEGVTAEEESAFLAGLSGAGRLCALPENLIDAGASVCGCGPAYTALFLEALADGGVACGLPRFKALELAGQMVLGTAKLMLETGAHPGQLKDAVCSPGGTTIQGVRVLEQREFRGAAMDAVIASYEKALELKK